MDIDNTLKTNIIQEDIQDIEDIEEDIEEDKIYLSEELPDIEYYEILTFDEIASENPTFIAFSKKEIYNELFEIFNNINKTNNFVELFYDIIEKIFIYRIYINPLFIKMKQNIFFFNKFII